MYLVTQVRGGINSARDKMYSVYNGSNVLLPQGDLWRLRPDRVIILFIQLVLFLVLFFFLYYVLEGDRRD